MPNAAGLGAGFDAIGDAIRSYMQMRQTKFENQRQLAGDARAEEQLGLDRQASARADAAAAESTHSTEQNFLTNFTKLNGGMPVAAGDPLIGRYQKAGLGAVLQPQEEAVQRIGDRTLTGGIQPIHTPTQPSGAYTIADNPDDALQRTLINAQVKYFTSNQANDTRRYGIDAGTANNVRSNSVRQAIATAAQALQRRGQDISVDNLNRTLDRLGRLDYSNAADDAFQNYIRYLATPEGLMEQMNQDGGMGAGTPPPRPPLSVPPAGPPNYFAPAGTGGDRFGIVGVK